MSAVTAIKVVVARMIPSSVRKLRSLFLPSDANAMRVASQNEALGLNLRVMRPSQEVMTELLHVLFRLRSALPVQKVDSIFDIARDPGMGTRRGAAFCNREAVENPRGSR